VGIGVRRGWEVCFGDALGRESGHKVILKVNDTGDDELVIVLC